MEDSLHLKQEIESTLADDEFAIALERCNEALRWYPESPDFHRLRATALTGLGDTMGALTVLQEAILRLPAECSLFTALGNLYISEFRDLVLAEQQFVHAITLNPNEYDGYLGYAHCRLQQGGFEEVLSKRPAQAHPELLLEAVYIQLRNLGRYTEARSATLRWLHEFGRHPDALLALARIEEEADHDMDAARRHIGTALHLSPAASQCHIAYIALLLKNGKWEDASRQVRSMMKYFGYSYPRFMGGTRNWDGSSLEGKTILLDNTLGLGYGDLIQFSRFALVLHEQGATVGIRTRKALKSLLATVSGVDFVISLAEPVKPVDYMAEMSLVWLFLGLGMEHVAASTPYLKADRAERFDFARDGFLRVGIVPRSGERHLLNQHTARNVPIEEFAPLATIPSVRFYSFEIPPTPPPLQSVLPCAAHDEVVTDFYRTATALSQMDVVVTVDTAMAHLAGALGKPGFLLLPYSADWRWLLNRDDTPWYPSFRLIRQTTPGGWPSVVQECAASLTEYAQQQTHSKSL